MNKSISGPLCLLIAFLFFGFLMSSPSTAEAQTAKSETEPVFRAVTSSSFSVQGKYVYKRYLALRQGAGAKFLVIDVLSVEIDVPKGARDLEYLQAGLAEKTEKGWKIFANGEKYRIDKNLKPNETLIIRDISFRIPVEGSNTMFLNRIYGKTLDQAWPVFTIGLKGGGTTYTHGILNEKVKN